MVTFKDLKIGDSIYEVGMESKKIWIDKIEDISINTFFMVFECIDQDGLIIRIDIPVEHSNKCICKYGSIYATSMNLLLTAICDS